MTQQQISDQNEREEALKPDQSFIVQAPAGSGKTGLLTQRFLVLLAHALEAPEECLAITFTRKAASEMKDRVLDALLRARDPNPPSEFYERKTWELARKVGDRDRALGWDLLNNPNRLKIQTIDALCLSITRQMPIVSQLGSPPQIIEDASLLYQMAARQLLESLESNDPWSSSMSTLLEHLDNNLALAEQLLADMLPHRDQWLPYIGHALSQKEARAVLESSLRGVVQEALIALVKSIPVALEGIEDLAQYAAEHLERLNKDSSIRACKGLKRWPSSDLDDLPIWKGLSELLLTQELAFRKTITEQQGFPAPSRTKDKADKAWHQTMKTRMLACLASLQEYPIFLENLKRLCECPSIHYNEKQWEIIKALVQLLPVLTAELSLVFQEHAEVDFVEVSLSALKALGEWDTPTDLALGLDYKIRHILIDEFQDTSLTQFRLLEQLTAGWQPNDGRTLFLVGDPMQSIYRFRQAEVGLFIRSKQNGVGALSLKSLTLTTNFRSDPVIVTWSNQMFGRLFPMEDDIASSAIRFSPSQAARLQTNTAKACIESVTEESEASKVVEIIQSTLQIETDPSIALLVRSRSHLQTILPALRQAGIEYQGVQLEWLSDHPVVQDLLGLTRALIHLGDRIAWLTLLRSPYCAFSLADLWAIANQAPHFPIWYTLASEQILSTLSEQGKQRVKTMVPILSQALNQYKRLPLRAWVMETWLSLGGTIALQDDNSLQDAEAFFAILDEENKYDFYEVGVLERRLRSLFAKPNPTRACAVQVMTIHKAKGLEFDTVIVPGVGRKSLAQSSRLLLWEARAGLLQESYLIVAPIQSVGASQDPIYCYLKKQEEYRANHERMRLWYVAATRARRCLHWLTHDSDDWEEGIRSKDLLVVH